MTKSTPNPPFYRPTRFFAQVGEFNCKAPRRTSLQRTIAIALLSLACSAADAVDCQIATSENPNISYSINPHVTHRVEPDVTYSINPYVTYSINPNITYNCNPSVTYALNPEVTYSLNPNNGKCNGFLICSPDGRLVGASVIANDEVMVMYAGQKWIGYFV